MRDYAAVLPLNLCSDLLAAGWSGSSTPFPGQSARDYAMTCLSNSILKKFQDDIPDEANQRALALFTKVNESCSGYNWDPSLLSELDAIAIGEARGFIHDFFFPDYSRGAFEGPLLSFGKIVNGFGFGPGSNIGTRSNDFYSKIGTSVMSASSQELLDLFLAGIASEPSWSYVESIRSVVRGYAVVKGSRLSFVPKTREISRTICTEPLCNMLFQKGIGALIERRLQEVCGINLSHQPDKNRTLARLGSETGKFGTIDLSSASDSMSLGLVSEFFPPSVVSWLMKARTPVTVLPDGTEVELHMVSSMGNAFTFPLQTMFFASLVYGVYRARSIKIERPSRQSLGNFAVFGDDIIVLNEAYDHVARLLGLCGFKVNVDKSFNDGFFRESCGRDYYSGYNVRGVYLKTLHSVNDRYSAINRLNVWSACHSVPLPRTVSGLLVGARFVRVPFHEMDDAGVKVPLRYANAKAEPFQFGTLRYRCWAVRTKAFDITNVEERPPQIADWFNNPEALLMAALAGTLRDGKIIPRVNRKSYRLKSKSSPHWDYISDVPPDFIRGFGERWKSFVELNLNLS